MDFDSLRCFDAAATTLNFRAAADRVHLSPAAFSDRMKRLEEQLGVALFARTTRRIELSEAGHRLLLLARRILTGVEELQATARSPASVPPYEFVIGTRYELGLSWLCPAIKTLSRRRPERTLHLYAADSPDLLFRLERGDLDAVVGSMRLTSAKLTYASLHSEEYEFVSARRCLEGRDDARRVTLVDVSRDIPLFRYFLDALPRADPWPFAHIEYMGGIGNIRRRLLDEKDRVAVLPRYFARQDLASGRLVRLMPKVRLRSDAFRMVWREGHARTSELLALAEELRRLPLR
jgi:DNA-binding transcriptional LysR family regulator